MNNEEDFMLTTFDNPFNPFEEFEAWFKFDMLLGYNSCGLLAREANTNPIQSDELNEEREINAMKEICKREPFVYKMVVRNDYSSTSKSQLVGGSIIGSGPDGG